MSLLHGTRARLRLLFGRRAAESRMNEEIRFHVEMETDRLLREGLPSREARRRALIAFGGVEQHKEELRDGRGLGWLAGLSIDVKLALRMLVKYPGLTVVGIVGMAVAVAIGAISFTLIYTLLDPPALPLDEGGRVVAIQNVDARRGLQARMTHLHDFATWREGLAAVSELGAYHTIDRNLITRDGPPEPVQIAAMTASGFRIARVSPLLGRYFNDDDEGLGAAPVVVIGHTVWQGRFAGDSSVIGRTVQLGATLHTVIGVMPPGFAFPINNRVWTPFKLAPLEFERGEAPPIEIFGRLAPNASLHDAETQLAAIGRQLAVSFPRTHEHVRPRVLPYTRSFVESPELSWLSHLIQLLITMLLVVIGTNVAILVYARTASRTGEIAVRSALGASRSRIVGQLVAEAFVLSIAAALTGLGVAWLGLDRLNAFIDRKGGEQLPFWMEFGISPAMVLYVLGMAVLGAVIVGALPALKATRRQVQPTLQLGAGGTSMRLGKAWTAMIVAQVALAVSVLPLAIAGGAVVFRQAMAAPAVAPGEWMTASLRLDREKAGENHAAFAVRAENLWNELVRQVRSEAGVVAAVLASSVPGEEPPARIEVEGTATVHDVQVGGVTPDVFAAFGIPLLAGRGLEAGDVSVSSITSNARAGQAIVVNRSFVQQVLGGADPLGRRVRRVRETRVVVRRRGVDADTARAEPWSEIVGVVPDFPNRVNPRFPEPRIYQPLPQEPFNAVTIAVRVRNVPAGFGGRLRELAVAVDPMLRLQNVATLDESLHDRMLELRLMVGVVMVVTMSVLLLSAAGIYALISFTVARHRREIGIRSALGAGPGGIIRGVLSRAMRQIAIGIGIGIVIAGVLDSVMDGGFTGGRGVYLLALVAALMGSVGLVAAIGPARRALRIQPTEALKGD
jgi:putative ABC transport system permease protein